MNQQQDFADLAARQIVGDNGYANASYREAKVGEVATLIRECYSRKPPTLSLLGLTQEERSSVKCPCCGGSMWGRPHGWDICVH
jgi:hypothetical protein